MEENTDSVQSNILKVHLLGESELFIAVPESEPRCSARVTVQSNTGVETYVECQGAPLSVDVPYYLIAGQQVLLFTWSNAIVSIEGSDLLLRNVFRPLIKSLTRPIVEYHCLLHESRSAAEKNNCVGPTILICGRNDSPKAAIAKSLCNYASRLGWKPLLVDLDCGASQSVGVPGSVGAAIVEYPISIDDIFSHTHVSLTFFVGSTEVQRQTGDRPLSVAYTHFAQKLLDCCHDRLTKHMNNVFGWSGMIVTMPELKGNVAANYITEIVQRYGVSHVLTIGDDFLFNSLYTQYSARGGVHERGKVHIDRISKGHCYIPSHPLERVLPIIFYNYFHEAGPITLQPSQWSRTFESIDLFYIKDGNEQVQLSNIEREELPGIVGCICAVFQFNKISSPLTSSPFAYARVQSLEPSGITLLTSTPYTFLSERLTLVVGNKKSMSLKRFDIFSEQIQRDFNAVVDCAAPSGSTRIIFFQKNILKAFERMGILANATLDKRDLVGFFPLQESVDYLAAQCVIYFLNPDVENMRAFVVHLLSYTQRFPNAVPHVFFVPQKSLMIEHILENDFKLAQVFPDLKLRELDFDVIALEEDFYSMEQPLIFKHLFADGDITCLKWIARLLLKLQSSHFGAIPTIRGKGHQAARVVSILSHQQEEMGEEFMSEISSEVETLYIVDRGLDLITPLMTQLTYEGLIDELYDISCSTVTLPFGLDEGVPSGGSFDTPIVLDSHDKVFSEIRDKNFTDVGSALYHKSVWVKEHYEQRKNVQELKELREFMKGLPEIQEYQRLIATHAAIATEIGKTTQDMQFRRRVQIEQCIIQQTNGKEVLDFIEDMINKKEPLPAVLRMLSLYSLANHGFKAKDYDFFKERLMLSYGIPQAMSAFFYLDSCGLLSRGEGKSLYTQIRKHFRTWNNSALREKHSNDISYTYGGYAPLLIRLLEILLTSPLAWNLPGGIVDMLPGEKAEIHNNVEVVSAVKTSLIFVIGGLTAAEISALRFIQAQLANADKCQRIIIATTDVISGKRLITSLLPFDA